MTSYAIKAEVKTSFVQAVAATKAALATEGFGILTEIDVQATMKAKLGKDMLPYVILGACNPPHAFNVISAEPDIGLMLPCNVIVYERPDAAVVVAAINPEVAMQPAGNDELRPAAAIVRQRLERVVRAVEGTGVRKGQNG
ncbi:MAG: hypothetical protein BWY06_02919 [Candidatus Latescibacteria bacterium ADurb.Bin168]|nr:MAG: hypothetical protein BWY06_02919 [Candidatus Latescibacteria bacterium ADurb.Bin168]